MAVQVSVQPGAALAARAGALPDAALLRRVIARAVRATLRHEQVRTAEVSVTLLDDAEIAAMNAQFLAHEGPTDVISFALYDAGETPVGDIYIGLEEARRQAAANDVSLAAECARLAVHGTLHVLGHDHPEGAERVASGMWQTQEAILEKVLRP